MNRSKPSPAAGRPTKARAARERIAGHLDALLAERRDAELLDALRELARHCGGIGRVAERARVNRTFLYRMLSPNGNPEMRTIDAVLRTMGLRVGIRAMHRANGNGNGNGTGRGHAKSRPRVWTDRAVDKANVERGRRRRPKN